MTAANILFSGRKEAIKAYKKAVATVFNLTELTVKEIEYRDEMEVVSQTMQQCIWKNDTVVLDQTEYQERFKFLSGRFEAAKEKVHGSHCTNQRYTVLQGANRQFPEAPEDTGRIAHRVFRQSLDYATIYADGRMTFTFKNGDTIDG